MRILAAVIVLLVCVAWLAPVYASATPTYHRTVEYRVVEPCGVEFTSGEVSLEWSDCGGDFELVTVDLPDAGQPVTLLFYAGNPDWSELDSEVYFKLFCCSKCTKKMPDVYCASENYCDWYCYKTSKCWCGMTICARACLPCSMALEITDVY